MIRLSTVVALIVLTACASDESAIAACSSDIELLVSVAPEIPPRLHNSFEGYAIVEFELTEDGSVHQPRIISSQWNPVGRAGGEPDGYEAAILSAAQQWRYSPQEHQCRGTRRVEFRFQN